MGFSNRVDLPPPSESVNPDETWYHDLDWIRGRTVERLRNIADRIEAEEPGYKADDALNDLLDAAAALVAWNNQKTKLGAPAIEFALDQNTARRHLGEAAYRWLDGNIHDFRTRAAA